MHLISPETAEFLEPRRISNLIMSVFQHTYMCRKSS